MALLENAGVDELVHEVRKRIASLGRAHSFVDWHKQKQLVSDLDRQRSTIAKKIAPKEAQAALELMWRFLDIAGSIYERTDDSNGYVGDVFREGCRDLESLFAAARPDPEALADQVFTKVIDGNDYAQYDGLVGYATTALGSEGLSVLRSKVEAAQEQIESDIPGEDDGEVIGWSSSGPIYSSRLRHDSRRRSLRYILQEIADAQGDVDAFICGYEEDTQRVPAVAAQIAERLLHAGRPEEALVYLEQSDSERAHKFPHWIEIRLAVLEALGREDDAQSFRLQQFQDTLNAPLLRAYLDRLPDFEDFEAETRALEFAKAYNDAHQALVFLINWPDLQCADRLVRERAGNWDGNNYHILTPAAEHLSDRYPLAATILLRAMISHSLSGAKSKRYRYTARHLVECERLSGHIENFDPLPSHHEFVSALRQDHSRKSGFWSLV